MQLFQQQYRIIGSFGASPAQYPRNLAKMASGLLPVIDTEVPLAEFDRDWPALSTAGVREDHRPF
jgi:alcohol dehydrogenase